MFSPPAGRRLAALALLVAAAIACEGPPGPAGPPGPPGPGADASARPDVAVDTPASEVDAADASLDADATDVTDAPDVAADAEDVGRPDPRVVCRSCHPGLDVSTLNLVGIHNPASRRYNANCLHCHQDILLRTTLSPRVQEIHARMLPFAGTWRGAPRNEDCQFCHRGVDLSGERSAAGLRRQVPVDTCVGCHRDGRWDYYLP